MVSWLAGLAEPMKFRFKIFLKSNGKAMGKLSYIDLCLHTHMFPHTYMHQHTHMHIDEHVREWDVGGMPS